MIGQSLHHNVGSDRLRLHLANTTTSATVLQPLKMQIGFFREFSEPVLGHITNVR